MAENKDWGGNVRTTWASLGASSHTDKEREQHDYYATDPIAIDKLLNKVTLDKNIWECACGEGHLSERLLALGHNVYSSDLIDRNYGDVVNFLESECMPNGYKTILTNPPYKYASEFIKHGLDILPEGGKMYMFLKIQFLEGQTRFSEIFSTTPPSRIFVSSKRIICAKNGDFKHVESSAICYAWYEWVKGYKGQTIIDWL